MEIIFGMVLIGLTASALFAAISTASAASTAHRRATVADTVLRSYTEAAKLAVRTDCATGSTYTVVYTAPTGYTVTPTPGTATTCPVASLASGNLQAVTVTVTYSNGAQSRSMSIGLRSP